jgi:predicted DsbA family dithiol-disulfide isomerase
MRRLEREFGGQLDFTYVMGGLARDYLGGQPSLPAGVEPPIYTWLLHHWLDVSEESGAPLDPLLWARSPIRSTYPACMGVKAAAEQAGDGGGAYLRRLREGLMCGRRRLDSTDLLVEEAGAAGLDTQRFAVDLASSAIVEAFGADLQEARDLAAAVPDSANGSERVTFPSLVFTGEDEVMHGVWGAQPYEAYRHAAMAAGAVSNGEPPPGVEDALRRFGRMTGPEVAAVCELPGPRAEAELWRLAVEWRVRPVRVTTGHLWELAAG